MEHLIHHRIYQYSSLSSFERLGSRYACVRHCIHSAADVSDWWEEGGWEERKKMSRGEERGTSGSDVPGCASGSGRREVTPGERKRARKKGEKQRKRRAYRMRERKVRAERGNTDDTGASQTETR